MIKYDKIYIPAQQNDVGEYDQFVSQTPVIVLTIEELRECFKWGMDSFEDTQTPAQSFNDFLESKGINHEPDNK